MESRSKMPIRVIEHAMFSFVTHEALSRDNGHDINKKGFQFHLGWFISY